MCAPHRPLLLAVASGEDDDGTPPSAPDLRYRRARGTRALDRTRRDARQGPWRRRPSPWSRVLQAHGAVERAARSSCEPARRSAGPRGPPARPAARAGQRPTRSCRCCPTRRRRSGCVAATPLGLIGDPAAAGAVLAAVARPEPHGLPACDGRRGPAVGMGLGIWHRCCARAWPPRTPAPAWSPPSPQRPSAASPGACPSCAVLLDHDPDLTGSASRAAVALGRLGAREDVARSPCGTPRARPHALRRPVSSRSASSATRRGAGPDRAARRRRPPPRRARRRGAGAGRPCRHRSALRCAGSTGPAGTVARGALDMARLRGQLLAASL